MKLKCVRLQQERNLIDHLNDFGTAPVYCANEQSLSIYCTHLSASVYIPLSIALCLFLKEGAVRPKVVLQVLWCCISLCFSFSLPLHLNMNTAFCMGRMPPLHFKAALGPFKGSEGGEMDSYCLTGKMQSCCWVSDWTGTEAARARFMFKSSGKGVRWTGGRGKKWKL